MRIFLAVAAGGLLLLWPALLNGYPLLFSDTGAFLVQAADPAAIFDKPWAYAPLLLALDGRTTLWLPALFQGLLLSHLLHLAQKALGTAGALRHAVLAAALAGTTAAPWFAATLMPDIYAPLTVLCLFLLGWGRGRLAPAEYGWASGVGTVAIAVHLTHLVIAGACLPLVFLLRRRVWLAPALPLLLAAAWLAGVSLATCGRLALSPYGSVFLFARLAADGPATDYLRRSCPEAGGRLCAWADRMPRDSDDILWSPDGPIWAGGSGPAKVAPEAARVVTATIRAFPIAVARAMLANTGRQLLRPRVGDTLGPDWLDVGVGRSLDRLFPAAERARYDAALQRRGLLRTAAGPLLAPLLPALLAGLAATALLLGWALAAGRQRLAGLAALTLAACLANAWAAGALSAPHDRYEARLAWLLVAVPLLALAAHAPGWPCRDGRRWTAP